MCFRDVLKRYIDTVQANSSCEMILAKTENICFHSNNATHYICKLETNNDYRPNQENYANLTGVKDLSISDMHTLSDKVRDSYPIIMTLNY